MTFEMIPHHDGVMSIYTICTFTVLVSAWLLFTSIYIRYNSNEFRRVEQWAIRELKKLEEKCGDHDEYIERTNGTINKIHIDLAVQESSMIDLKADIAEIKADIKILLQRE